MMRRLVFGFVLVGWAACGGQGVGPDQLETCDVGDVLGCACTNGALGEQVCGEDGTWRECACPDTGCVPGRSEACTCADGTPGAEVCGGDGIWGVCECVSPLCVDGDWEPCACPDGSTGLQVCLADGTFDGCDCPEECAVGDMFCYLSESIVGVWEGTATSPWRSPYGVHITFEPDGHYFAQCLDDDCVAFYYGTDDDYSQKTYELVDVLANDTGVAEIRIVFDGGFHQTGTMSAITIFDDALYFEFWATWHAPHMGPVVFELTRVP